MAALQASIALNIPALIAFAAIVGVWAFFLPINVRDVDNRRLPPNPTARILFIFLSVLLYLVLVGALKLSGDAFENVGGEMFQAAMKLFKGQEPLMAVTVLAGLRTVPMFRELENNLIIWLHSARHLNSDAVTLTHHLQDCSFEPTPGEQQKNINNLREFDVYVTDTKANVLHLEAVNAWRKTSSLLRALRDWNDSKESVLNREDLKLLEQLEKAHRRKTRLAMDIIRMLELVERGGMSGSAMGEVAGQLASASHNDRAEIAKIENRLQEVLPGQGESREPVRLTYSELQQYLSQIEGYFRVEYRYLLQQAADLSAKSIVFAGEDASRRLDHLKTIGFGQLGHIERINFDRILWVFFAISLGGFLIMFLWPKPAGPSSGPGPDLYARIALVTALASLVGSVVGSNRKIQSRPITPWTHYLIAGLVAAGMFVLVHGTAIMLSTLNANPAAAEPVSTAPPFWSILPWAASPFFLAIAVCWLARLPRWPGVPAGNLERVCDGLAVCVVMLLAQATAFTLHMTFKTNFAEVLARRIEQEAGGSLLLLLFKPNPTLLIGFFVGLVVIRDVRRAAHAQLTDLVALRAYAQAEEQTKPLFSEDSVGVRLKPRLAASG